MGAQPLRHYPARRSVPALGLASLLSVHLACARTSPQRSWLTAERGPAWNAPSRVGGGTVSFFEACLEERGVAGGSLSCCQALQALE